MCESIQVMHLYYQLVCDCVSLFVPSYIRQSRMYVADILKARRGPMGLVRTLHHCFIISNAMRVFYDCSGLRDQRQTFT